MRDDSIYFQHVAESIDLIQPYLAGADGALNRALFYEDRRTQDAVLRRLETLADAASHLSDAVKLRDAEIPWRQISDFRNVLAHGYPDIRLDRVWEAVSEDLPALKGVVQEELRGTNKAEEFGSTGSRRYAEKGKPHVRRHRSTGMPLNVCYK